MKNTLNVMHEEFTRIGRLSSILPSYVRNVCRSDFDGTDSETLNALRHVGLFALEAYKDAYAFVPLHHALLQQFDARRLLALIRDNRIRTFSCPCMDNSTVMPKRVCLHCAEVGRIMRLMRAMNKEAME